MLKSAVFGIFLGSSPSSRRALRPAAPRSCRIRRRRCSPCPSDRSPACACAIRGTSARPRPASACRRSLMSKMRTPRNRSALTGAVTPCVPQSIAPRVCSTDMNSRLPWIDTSPCPPGQTTDATSRGLRGVLDVVGVEAVEVADDHVLAAERDVGIRESRSRRRGSVSRCSAGGVVASVPGAPRSRTRGGDHSGRCGRIEEPWRLGQIRHQLHVARGNAGVTETSLQAGAWIGSLASWLLPAAVDREDEHARGNTQRAEEEVSWPTSWKWTVAQILQKITHGGGARRRTSSVRRSWQPVESTLDRPRFDARASRFL